MANERWEYLTKFCTAHIDNDGAKEYLAEAFPDWNKPPKYTPETMIPELDDLGADGWELVHMQPVPSVGDNADVGYQGASDNTWWSNTYFCVFKRRVED